MLKKVSFLFFLCASLFGNFAVFASEAAPQAGIALAGIRVEFLIFGVVLLGIMLFHHATFFVSVVGLCVLLAYKMGFTEFALGSHLHHEARGVINLLGLLLGFAVLAKHFEETKIPEKMPEWLPGKWVGGALLLFLIGLLSSVLDNIASAMIGGTIARQVFKGKVHIGYLAAIVAASNAGGAGSVIGDTTTTMMWIDGVPAVKLLPAFVGAFFALVFVALFAAPLQDRYQTILSSSTHSPSVDFGHLWIVILSLLGMIAANVFLDFPAVGAWAGLLLGGWIRKTPWAEVSHALKGSLFLIALVLSASMMPVEELPKASWQTAFGLGFLSSIFDNIPLTKLALEQGGYDWSLLAFAVGYGGSMVWFGSSAGVALSQIFPEIRSVSKWVKAGWFILPAYMVGFFAMLWLMGWNPLP